jgi:hypothetical protein
MLVQFFGPTGSSARSAANASIISSSSAKPICAKFLQPTPAITTNSERICPWTRIRRVIGRSTDMARSQRGRSSADFIINTAGYSFQQGHPAISGMRAAGGGVKMAAQPAVS